MGEDVRDALADVLDAVANRLGAVGHRLARGFRAVGHGVDAVGHRLAGSLDAVAHGFRRVLDALGDSLGGVGDGLKDARVVVRLWAVGLAPLVAVGVAPGFVRGPRAGGVGVGEFDRIRARVARVGTDSGPARAAVVLATANGDALFESVVVPFAHELAVLVRVSFGLDKVAGVGSDFGPALAVVPLAPLLGDAHGFGEIVTLAHVLAVLESLRGVVQRGALAAGGWVVVGVLGGLLGRAPFAGALGDVLGGCLLYTSDAADE